MKWATSATVALPGGGRALIRDLSPCLCENVSELPDQGEMSRHKSRSNAAHRDPLRKAGSAGSRSYGEPCSSTDSKQEG